jgi:hypothetical protein
MSKKVNVIAPGIARGNLLSLFKQYVTRRVKEEHAYWASVGRCLGGRNSLAYLMGLDDDYDEEMEKLRQYYDGMSDDDYYVDDDGCIVFPPSSCHTSATEYDEDEYFRNLNKLNNKGKYKHRKHRRGGKAKVIDINTPYSGSEDEPFTDESEVGMCKIYFYPNYEDKYDRIEFDSLIEFDKYCQEEGYLVPPYVGEAIAYKPVSHCCLNPYAKEHGILEIMAEESYADMLYEASDEMSLTER